MEFKGKGRFPRCWLCQKLLRRDTLRRGDPAHWHRRAIAQRAVRAHSVVMRSPHFHNDLSFFERIENLPVQTLVSQLAIERLTVSIFPRTSRLDEQRLRAYCLLASASRAAPSFLRHCLTVLAQEPRAAVCIHPGSRSRKNCSASAPPESPDIPV